jgi:DNA-directed RNA polymerase subunit RPC12/RpoP
LGYNIIMEKLDLKKCDACSEGPPDWRYSCRECKNEFTMPAPKGPSEEKERACPKCHSKNIERIGLVKSEACPPGG